MADLDVLKNIQDWNCDVLYNNPIAKTVRPDLVEKCHKGAEIVTDEAKDLVKNPAGYVAGKVLDGTFNQILESFWNGSVGVYKQFIASWIHAGPIINPSTSPAFSWGSGVVNIFTMLAVTIGIMIAGIKIVWEQRGEEIRYVLASLGRVILVSGLGVILVSVLLTASDQAAAAILDSTDWGHKDTMAVLGDPAQAITALGALLFLPGAIMVLVVIVQWCIMIFVAIATPVLLMYWPVSEGITFAAGGRGFSRVSKWLLAFILFKPTVAVLYGFAFEELKGGDGIGGIVTAVCILTMAPFTLPALLKIVNPAAAGTGADGAGTALAGMAGMAVGAAGMAAGMATGGASAAASGAGAASSGATATAFMISDMGPTLAESGGVGSLAGAAAGATTSSSNGAGTGTGGSSAGAAAGAGIITAPNASGTSSGTGGSSGGSELVPASEAKPAPAPAAGGRVGIGVTVSAGSDTGTSGQPSSGGAGGAPAASRLAQAAQILENRMPRAEAAEEALLDEQSLDRTH